MGLDYRQARFLTSAATLEQCPPDTGNEAAFLGRSNAGKSSAINALTGQRGLARTSRTPGRTQLLNFFALAEDRRLVDLPGFGYAKVPAGVKQRWQRQLELYLERRESLRGLVLLMDIRHPFKEFDRRIIDWAHRSGLPLHVLLTKVDKLKRGAAGAALLGVRKELAGYGDAVTAQLFSAHTCQGVEALGAVLDGWLEGNRGSVARASHPG